MVRIILAQDIDFYFSDNTFRINIIFKKRGPMDMIGREGCPDQLYSLTVDVLF